MNAPGPPPYRKVSEMTADELLVALRPTPRHQLEIFVSLGGDPNDHNYARLSYLTQQLRNDGHDIRSDRQLGIWLDPGTGGPSSVAESS